MATVSQQIIHATSNSRSRTLVADSTEYFNGCMHHFVSKACWYTNTRTNVKSWSQSKGLMLWQCLQRGNAAMPEAGCSTVFGTSLALGVWGALAQHWCVPLWVLHHAHCRLGWWTSLLCPSRLHNSDVLLVESGDVRQCWMSGDHVSRTSLQYLLHFMTSTFSVYWLRQISSEENAG